MHELSTLPIVYAVLSFTMIRMVAAAIALTGTHLRATTVGFMGWFGLADRLGRFHVDALDPRPRRDQPV